VCDEVPDSSGAMLASVRAPRALLVEGAEEYCSLIVA
jgi:hypothetical protein